MKSQAVAVFGSSVVLISLLATIGVMGVKKPVAPKRDPHKYPLPYAQEVAFAAVARTYSADPVRADKNSLWSTFLIKGKVAEVSANELDLSDPEPTPNALRFLVRIRFSPENLAPLHLKPGQIVSAMGIAISGAKTEWDLTGLSVTPLN